ncbi:hypothetical protein, partial [Gordonia westfalica]|uniref:hypothetical protein n=1 Tax=Gordonia westfalica TaxID=158898 RepID=UPI001AD836A6
MSSPPRSTSVAQDAHCLAEFGDARRHAPSRLALAHELITDLRELARRHDAALASGGKSVTK